MKKILILNVLILMLVMLFGIEETYAASVLADSAAVGQYVTYKPTVTSYNVPTTDSGYTAAQNYNPSAWTSWRVFSINNGKVTLISTSGVGWLNLTGYKGYANIVKILTNISAKFENSTFTASSRALRFYF